MSYKVTITETSQYKDEEGEIHYQSFNQDEQAYKRISEVLNAIQERYNKKSVGWLKRAWRKNGLFVDRACADGVCVSPTQVGFTYSFWAKGYPDYKTYRQSDWIEISEVQERAIEIKELTR